MFIGIRNVLLLFVCLFFAIGQSWAVALGKIEVTSHLGETFFAEAPVLLDAGEKISDVSIELAGSSDYQILEVFRDSVLNGLNVEIKNDLRGSRAVISSTEAVDTPYFNLVLKMKHGHATNFKKYPVFLDLPEQVRPAAPESRVVEQAIAPPASVDRMQAGEPRPAASAISMHPDDTEATIEPATVEPAASGFKPYEGWARTGRYGPMVRGDTISTVALRLSVGQRYTQSQVMVGLFNKNKEKFRENNINLINAGTYLDVPTANEIEAIQDRDARRILKEHAQRWKDLKSQPVYAAEAEAQKNRYRTRVHVGQTASGAAAAPVQGGRAQPEAKGQAQPMQHAEVAAEGAEDQLRALQEENLRLTQALQESEAKVKKRPQPATADAAVAEEQVKKLELTVARLQRQLKQVDTELQEVRSQDMNALTYALSGIIMLLIAVAGYLLFLLRRERPHPAMDMSAAQPVEEIQNESGIDDSMPEDAGSEDLAHGALIEPADSGLGNADVVESPTPQAGVDYVAEAEVYLRYGMEDEALQQLRLGIEQRPGHLQAHSKLVEILQGRGDQVAIAAAVEAARSALAADDLQAFENSLSSTEGDAAPSAELDTAEEPSFEDDALGLEIMPGDMADDDLTMAADAGAVVDVEEQDEEVTADLSDQLASDQSPSDQSPADLDMSDFEYADLYAESSEEKEASEEDASSSGLEPEADLAEPVELSEEPEAPEKADVEESALSDEQVLSEKQIDDALLDGEEGVVQTASEDDAVGLDFTLDDKDLADADLAETPGALASDDKQDSDDGIAFEASGESADENGEDISDAVIDASAEDGELDLDTILDELETDVGSSVDFVTAADAVSPLESDTAEDTVPETVIEAASAAEDLDLDEILGEFDHMAEDSGADSGVAGDDAADSLDIAAMPDMDVSDELDGLLTEWDEGKDDSAEDAGPESLGVDRARSLLAEGLLDEAETALQSALDGDRRGDALIGLAEAAAKRGDDDRKNELLTEAESLVDDSNRDWFDLVKNLSV